MECHLPVNIELQFRMVLGSEVVEHTQDVCGFIFHQEFYIFLLLLYNFLNLFTTVCILQNHLILI